VANSTAPAGIVAAAPPSNVKVDPKTLKYVNGLVQKYDTNRDGVLTKDEWSSMSKSPEKADTDGDGKITPLELAIAQSAN
jgi:hypothetical protein